MATSDIGKAEFFNVKNRDTGEVEKKTLIPLPPSDGDLGGISEEELAQITTNKEKISELKRDLGELGVESYNLLYHTDTIIHEESGMNSSTGELVVANGRKVFDIKINSQEFVTGGFYPDSNYWWLLDANKVPVKKVTSEYQNSFRFNGYISINQKEASYLRVLYMDSYADAFIVKREDYEEYLNGKINSVLSDSSKQDKITPQNMNKIDFFDYLSRETVTAVGGYSSNLKYLSVKNYPVENYKYIFIINTADNDKTTRKHIAFFNSDGVAITIDYYTNATDGKMFEIPEPATNVSITILSDKANYNEKKSFVDGYWDIYMSDKKPVITSVNGFDIGVSDDIKTHSECNKNAMVYNVLPTNDAETNTKNMQKLLDIGGDISVTLSGVYEFSDVLQIGDNTNIHLANDVLFKRTSDKGLFINKGALIGETNVNINIDGLNIDDGINTFTMSITGLRGLLSMYHVKNVKITNIKCENIGSIGYLTQFCDWENVIIDGIVATGRKDAVHVGRGKAMVVKNGYFKTYDDPIALNAHDYPNCVPMLGWIENVVIENCYDLSDSSTTGYFARLLGGSWLDWGEGNEYRHSDIVVSNNKLYRLIAEGSGTTSVVSIEKPTHDDGEVMYSDGLKWRFIQNGIIYNCGCKDVTFRDIYLQKNRPNVFSFHFDDDSYSRSYYPKSTAPIQSNILMDGLHCQSEITNLISCLTPVDSIRIVNSDLLGNFNMAYKYGMISNIKTTNILMMGCVFKHMGEKALIHSYNGFTIKANLIGNIKQNSDFSLVATSDVQFINNDMA